MKHKAEIVFRGLLQQVDVIVRGEKYRLCDYTLRCLCGKYWWHVDPSLKEFILIAETASDEEIASIAMNLALNAKENR